MGTDVTDVERLADEIEDLRTGMEQAHAAREGVDDTVYADHYDALELCAILLKEVKADTGESRAGDTELIKNAAELLRKREAELDSTGYPSRGDEEQ